MCVDAEYNLKSQIKQAIHDGLPEEEIEDMKRELWILTGDPFYDPDEELDIAQVDVWPGLEEYEYYHVNGYAKPTLLSYTGMTPLKIAFAEWGFVPFWVETMQERNSYKAKSNNNLNAQSGHMFTNRTFADGAKWGRCVVMLDAYYEHHDYGSKKYPFRIFRKDGKPMYIGCISRKADLYDEESGEEMTINTLAFLTCKANPMMAKIHNNEEMVKRTGHRMLVILEEDQISDFLKPYPVSHLEKGDPQEEKLFQEEILNLCQPFPQEKMGYHSVINLRKRKEMPYIGNTPEITKVYVWEDLDYEAIKVEGKKE
ncbi:hypothetical protein BFP97_06330 [Roseivirga sp. 4D4]|uniref:SOS response-associated peptidase n=1 Tax=Roseivirga sp. 4D4 TaxID=1889784 RepID=UPI000852B678|nr:SOS response-associated peptidase family protein [Roseivirga sp. 4D4]OEK01148.1 hypothetical protein BFP97_06330 [Roseivirga sp. 4D4]